MRRLAIFWLLAGLLACCGCSSLVSSWNSFNPLVDRPTIASQQQPIVDIACMWQPAEGRGSKGVPSKGFAGQIYFFSQQSAEPILVTGDVRVYLFADAGTYEDRTRPLHQYDFRSEAWKAHASHTSLGPGYTVFVPYPKPAHYQVRCHLRVRYQPPYGGPPIWSEGLEVVLGGPPRPDQMPVQWDTSAETIDLSNNEITIKHQSVSADKLSGDQIAAVNHNQDATPLNMKSFTVGTVVTADYTTIARNRQPHKSGKHSGKSSPEHPLSQMNGEEKAALVRRLLGREGVEMFKNQQISRKVASVSKNELREPRRLPKSPAEEVSPVRNADHPFSNPIEHPLADSAQPAPWSVKGRPHPLSVDEEEHSATIEPLKLNNQIPVPGTIPADQESLTWNKVFGGQPRNTTADRSTQTSITDDWPTSQRFVKPIPNRAVLFSKGSDFPAPRS